MLVALQDPPLEVRLAETVAAHRDGLLAVAIRHMAHELYEYQRTRVSDADEVLDRTTEWLANRLGRCPTAEEAAFAAGMTVEEVLASLEDSADADGARSRWALALRCQGYDRDAIAAQIGVGRCAVSRLLRGALRDA